MRILAGSISTYVFSIRGGQPLFLLLLRAPGLLHAGTWQAVHGMVEPDETAVAAAWRECVEETGLTPQRLFRIDYVERFYSEHTDAVHLVPAFAAFVEYAPAAVISHEHTDHAWCTLEEAQRGFVWSSQREAVATIATAIGGWPATTTALTDLTHLIPTSDG